MKDKALIKGWTLVVSSFAVVFAFSTVDHAISPLVEWLQEFFGVAAVNILWLISSCTAGIVVGLFVGPQFIKSVRISRAVWLSLLMMAGGVWAFVATPSFALSLAVRFVFGLGAGLFSTVLWWLAYESIDRRFYTPMITVLTAARPMAVAAGVPLVMYGGQYISWRWSFAALGVITVLFCLAFLWASPTDNAVKHPFTPKALLQRYRAAWNTPRLKTFFSAMFINRLCYFGFYSMLGLWFIGYYDLKTVEIARPLMAIGICETLINFVVPFLLKVGAKKLFYVSVLGNAAAFAVFAWGVLPLWWAIVFIGLFAMTDRIYNMLLLLFIPKVFDSSKDRTTIGSLVTLVSWAALMAVSWLEGALLNVVGLNGTAAFLLVALIAGTALYIKVLKRTVFAGAAA